MGVYVICFLLLFIASFLSKNKAFQGFAILFMLFISMFRAVTVGTDTIAYYSMQGFEAEGVKAYEYIYYVLLQLKPILGDYLIIRVTAIVQFVFTILACKRFGVKPVMGLFFFFLFGFFDISLNIARQYAAACILLYAYSYLQYDGKERLKFFLYVFLAAGFHVTSIAFALLYFVVYLKIERINPIILVIILVACEYIFKTYLNEVFQVWSLAFVDQGDLENYSTYFKQAEVLTGGSLGNMILGYTQLLLKIFVLLKLCKSDTNKAVTSLFFVSIIIDLFFSGLWGNLNRMRHSIMVINIIAFSMYFLKTKGSVKYIVLLLAIVFFGYSLYYSVSNNAYGTIPYKLAF